MDKLFGACNWVLRKCYLWYDTNTSNHQYYFFNAIELCSLSSFILLDHEKQVFPTQTDFLEGTD